MKKTIAILLILVSVFSLAACKKGDKETIDRVGEMFISSNPTKILMSTSQTYGDTVLEGDYVLLKGVVNGLAATVYTENYDELISVDDSGASSVVTGSVVEKSSVMEYLEGYGVRVDGGAWDNMAVDFYSEVGPMSLNISSDYISEFSYENNKFSCVVEAKNTAEVLGLENDLSVDISIETIDDGASMTAIVIYYTIPADESIEAPKQDIKIKAYYFYDVQNIVISNIDGE